MNVTLFRMENESAAKYFYLKFVEAVTYGMLFVFPARDHCIY